MNDSFTMRNQKIQIRSCRTPKCSLTVLKIAVSFLFIGTILYGIFSFIHDITSIKGHKRRLERRLPGRFGMHGALSNFSQDKLELARSIKRSLIQPSVEPYSLNKPYPVEPHVLERAVRQITNLTIRGTFVEVGAGDGEYRCPTLCLEIEDNWYGMLVEPNPYLWKAIDDKHRKVYLSPTCVGIHNYSYQGYLSDEGISSRVYSHPYRSLHTVPCYPLYSHLQAFGTTSIDFLVLNINGDEAKVLKTLYWDEVNIKIIAVASIDDNGRNEVDLLLRRVGYKLHQTYTYKGERFDLFIKLPVNGKYQDKTTFYFIS